RDLVGPVPGGEVEGLHLAQVHGDGADVAEEAHPTAVGGDVDLLGDVGAVEQHGVSAGLALDGVAAVARVPLEHVVAGAHLGQVVAVVAVDDIVAVAAVEGVVALATEDGVPAGPAVHGELDHGAGQGGGGHGVVAAQGVDGE